MRKRTIPSIRFWAKVQVIDDLISCWIYTGKISAFGYGRFSLPNPEREVGAHRFAYEDKVGEIPYGMIVCHSCDVRSCVRPSHLFVGTYSDNTKDAIKKGRFTQIALLKRGDKLTEDQVVEIKHALSCGVNQATLGRKYGVSQTMISAIKRGIAWKHVHLKKTP